MLSPPDVVPPWRIQIARNGWQPRGDVYARGRIGGQNHRSKLRLMWGGRLVGMGLGDDVAAFRKDANIHRSWPRRNSLAFASSGRSESAVFQIAKNSSYRFFAVSLSPWISAARALPKTCFGRFGVRLSALWKYVAASAGRLSSSRRFPQSSFAGIAGYGG